jgi:glycogen phosphorylase
VRFGGMTAEMRDARRRVAVQVHLGALDPDAVCVELYADPANDGKPERHTMQRTQTLDESGDSHEYCVSIPATRALDDYTPRLFPRHPLASIPLEASEILWQR